MRTIVFWQDLESIHQSAVIRALAQRPDRRVVLVTQRLGDRRRGAMGWNRPDLSGVECHSAPTVAERNAIIWDASSERDFHLFTGIRAVAGVFSAFREVVRGAARVGIIAEGADPRGAAGVARRALYRAYCWRYGRHIDLIMAMGQNGVEWYRGVGFAEQLVRPYAYFVERPSAVWLPVEPLPNRFTFAFVGELSDRKGIELLIRALASMKDRAWRLRVVGDGARRGALQRLAAQFGVADRIEWLGFESNIVALSIIASADLLVLPSRHDGWGAVVNESLAVGVPALCSDACGARDLLHAAYRGDVFQNGDVRGLTAVLKRRLDAGSPSRELRERIRKWADNISGEVGAEYLDRVLDALAEDFIEPVPVPLWYVS